MEHNNIVITGDIEAIGFATIDQTMLNRGWPIKIAHRQLIQLKLMNTSYHRCSFNEQKSYRSNSLSTFNRPLIISIRYW